jgi:hypothetical protein
VNTNDANDMLRLIDKANARADKAEAENAKLREALTILRSMIFEQCDETNGQLMDFITAALGK